MFKQLLFLILVMAMAVPAFGKSLDKDFIAGREAHQAGDYKRAFTLFKDCAEKGHCGCMNSLGNCYLDGIGVEKDIVEAIRKHTRPTFDDEKQEIVHDFALALHG